MYSTVVLFSSASMGRHPHRAATELRYVRADEPDVTANVICGVTAETLADLQSPVDDIREEAWEEWIDSAYFFDASGGRFEILRTENGEILAVCDARLTEDERTDLYGPE